MKRKPLINYDASSDVFYIVFKSGPEETVVEMAPGINVELDENGQIIGIEILHASKLFKPVFHQPFLRKEEKAQELIGTLAE